MKKKFVIFLSSILLAISSLLVPVFNRDKMSAKAEATSDTTSYVSVGELWDSTNNVINTDNFLTMLKYTTGSDNISYGKLANTAYESLSAKEIKSLSHSGKAAGKNIVVTLGGLTWDVVYLSTDVNGEPIVTLWLSNSQQELWKTGSYYTGPYNSFDPNGQIRSQWSVWQANSLAATDQIPSNMYSTSYIHTVTLNNGGSYLSAYETLNSVSQNSNSAFALYTMEEFGLTDYLTTPAEVGWQLNQSAKTVLGVPNDFPNEASGELSVESWYSSTFDYTNKNGYFSWANDYLWLPSITEIGDAAEKGIWKVSDDQRKHVNGTSTSMESQAFLRTARASDITSVRVLMPTGASGDANYWTSYNRSLRPALHINIKKVYDYINETKSTDYSVIYLDPVYGDDSYSGDFLTPIKTIKLAEKMVEENGKVVLLNTLTILEDTVLGSYKNYTLQRYYGGDGDSFKGILIQAGKFVSNGSADNIHVNLSLQKITIDGNSRKNGTITNARTNWGTFAGSNQGLNGDGSLIMAANAKIIVGEDSCLRDNYLARGATMTNGAGIYLNNDSTALVAGGTFDNLCAYDYGGAFYNHTYGQIVIDNGTFINNSVQITGGVAYFAHATGTSIVINDGIFGYAYDADDDGTLAQSEIHGNYGQNGSGVISGAGTLTINGGVFDYNIASSSSGAIANVRNLIVNGGRFTNNSTLYDGYVIKGAVFEARDLLQISDSYFEGNIASVSASIFVSSKAIVKNTTFKNNQAKVAGVAFADATDDYLFENCVFERNKSTSHANIEGDVYGAGVLYATGTSVINIKDCRFIGNNSIGDGGVFVTTNDVTFSCYGSYFEDNVSAEKPGTSASVGGVGSHASLWKNLNNYYNCEFVGNTARSQAGAVANANVYNCTFKGNRSGWNGGACYVVNAYNCDFIENSTYNGGGAVSAAYTLKNCYFENNTTDNSYGGAAYIVQDVIGCEFVNNKAAGVGGAIAHNGSWFTYTTIDDCTFTGNYSDKEGGAIYLDASSPETGFMGIAISNCYIENNISKIAGAGIYLNFENAGLILGKANTPNYMFVDNNYIGTNFDAPSTVESNLYNKKVGANFEPIALFSNLEEGSVIDLASNVTLTNELVAKMNGENAFINNSTIEAFTYNGVNYDFYSNTIYSGNVKTGVGIYVKPVNGSGIVYTASDNYAEYDGLAHTINIDILSPADGYGIVYSTEQNGTYTTTPITVREPGETATVWFKIISDSFGETTPESRVVTIEKLDIFVKTELVAKVWIGESFVKDTNIPVAVSGEIVDIYGNAIACDFLPKANKTIAKGDHNHEIEVTISPKNVQKYKTLSGKKVLVKISYEQLFYKEGAFYVDYAGEQTNYRVLETAASIADIAEFLEDDSVIYFVSTYAVTKDLTIVTDKDITFARYIVTATSTSNFKKEIFNVNTGKKLTIGSLDMAGSITVSGGNLDAKAEEALIKVMGTATLNIYGNVTLTRATNYSSSTQGAGIYSEGTLNIDGATFFMVRTKLSGGGLYNKGTATIKNTFVRSCNAKVEGSGIFSSGTLTIENCEIINNAGWIEGYDNDSYVPKGAGLSINGSSAKATIISSSILSNTITSRNVARYGGNFYIAGGADVTVKDCHIVDGQAQRGAGVYIQDNSTITLINTRVDDNRTPASNSHGSAFFIEENATVNFISGSISGNYIGYQNVNSTRGAVYVKGTFNFGEYGSLNAVMSANYFLGNNTPTSTWQYGVAIVVNSTGTFNMYGGAIHEHNAGLSTIEILAGGKAYLYSGEFYLNTCSGENAVINVKGELFMDTDFYTINSIGAAVYSQDKARVHFMGDIKKIDNVLTLKYISTTGSNGETVVNGMILDLIAEDEDLPTEEEWNKFLSKITWYNGSSKLTYGTNVVAGYNPVEKRFYARVNNSITAKTVYFSPASGRDTNSGTEKAKPVQSWEKVLSLNPTTVYLLSTWEISSSPAEIMGNNIILKRDESFTGNMFSFVVSNVTIKISNLTIDGNADKNGTAKQFKDYLISSPAIYTTTGLDLILNNVTIKNNATKTSGAGIYIKADTSNGNYRLTLVNSNIINNAIIMDSTVSSSAKVFGAGLAIDNADQNAQNVSVKLIINNCDISKNSLVSTTGGHTGSSLTSYTRGGMGVGIYANYTKDYVKNVNIDIKNTKFLSNKVSGTQIFYGAAILFVNPGSTANTKNNEVNFNVHGCTFKNNGADVTNYWTSDYSAVFAYYSVEGAKGNISFKDCNFNDNGCYRLSYIYSKVKNSSVEFIRCVVSETIKTASTYLFYTSLVGKDTRIVYKNCEISGVKSVDKKGIQITSAASSADDYPTAIIEDCMIYNLNQPVNSSKVNLEIKNSYIHDFTTSTGFAIEISSGTILIDNCHLYRNYGTINLSSSVVAKIKNSYIFQSTYIAVQANTNVQLTFENCELFNISNNAIVVNEGSKVKGINTKIYNTNTTAIKIASKQGTVTEVSGFELNNITEHAIECTSGAVVGTLNISNMKIKNVYRSGIYLSLGSNNLNSSNNYTTIINIENCVIENCNLNNYLSGSTIYAGIAVHSSCNYNESTPTTSTKVINIKNTKLLNNKIIGFYGYYGSSSNPYVVTQINFDSNCEISGSRVGIYDYKTTAVKTHVYSGSPKITNNSVAGIALSQTNSTYRVDLQFTNAVITNNTLDIRYPKVYIEGTNNDIGKIYCHPETSANGITFTNTTSFKNQIKVIHYQSSITADMKIAGASYAATAAEMGTYLTKFALFGWKLEVSGTTIITKETVAFEEKTNIYYLDCRNTTTRATDAEDGKNEQYPVRTFKHLWDNCIDHTKKSIVYLFSYMSIVEEKVYDFKNVTFVMYTNKTTGDVNFNSTQFISIEKNLTIKNLTFDGKDFEDSSTIKCLLYSTSNYDIVLENVTIKNFTGTGSYFVQLQNSKSVTIKDCNFENLFGQTSAVYLYGIKSANITNCKFYNNNSYGLYIYYPYGEHIIKDCVFEDNIYGLYANISGYNYKIKVENCDFISNVYGINYSSAKITETIGCDFANNSNALYYSSISNTSTTKIDDCIFENSYSCAIYLSGNSGDNQPVEINNCRVLNSKNDTIYLYGLKSVKIKDTEMFNGQNYGIRHNSADINLDLQNVEISNFTYGIHSINAKCNITLVGYIENCRYGIYAANAEFKKGTIKNNEYGIYSTGSFVFDSGFIQNNDTGIYISNSTTINGGVIGNNKNIAIESSSDFSTLTINGGIIDSTNGTKQVMLASGEIVSYSIYCPGTINISGEPIITAPILTTTFDKSRVKDSSSSDVYFTVQNKLLNGTTAKSYGWYDSGDGLRAGNTKIDSTEAAITFTATKNFTFNFTYYIESESVRYDYCIIYKNGTVLVTNFGGTVAVTAVSVDLVVGDTISFYYRKDGSSSVGIDTPVIRGIHTDGSINATSKTNNNIETADKPYYVTPTATTYTFAERNDGALVNTNSKGVGTGSTATYTMIATKDFTLSFDYLLYCYTNSYFQVKINGAEDVKTMGTSAVAQYSYSKAVEAGDSIDIIFYKGNDNYIASAIITGLDYSTPMITPTVIIGALGTKALVNFVVPSNAVKGDAIASYNGASGNLDATIKQIKVNGFAVAKNVNGSKYGIILADGASNKNDVRDISNYIFFDPNNTALDDNNNGRTPQTAVKSWDRVLQIASETGCDKVFAMSVWQINADTTIEGNGLTMYRYYLSSTTLNKDAIMIQVMGGKNVVVNNLNFNGNYKINGVVTLQSANRLFKGEANTNITINNSVIENYAVKYDGASPIIHTLGNVKLESVILKDNIAIYNSATKTSNSAMIYCKGNLEANNCIFENNTDNARGNSSNKVGGGVININGTEATTELTLKITNSKFIKNTTFYNANDVNTGHGAAFASWGVENIIVDNCEFIGNRAGNYGGAFYATAAVNVDITNSIFKENYVAPHTTNADLKGHAIYISASTNVNVDNCYFYRNGTESGNYALGTLALRNDNNISITNCEFEYNQARQGAAIYIDRSDSNTCDVTIDNIYVHKNYSDTDNLHGALVYVGPASGSPVFKISVSNSVFENYSGRAHNQMADDPYSLFFFKGKEIDINNLDVQKIVKRYEADDILRVEVTNGGTVNIDEVDLINNYIQDGSVMRVLNGDTNPANITMNISNIYAKQNYSIRTLAFYVDKAYNSTNTLTLKNCTLVENAKLGDSMAQGNGLLIGKMKVNVENVTVANHHYLEGEPLATVRVQYCSGTIENMLLKDCVQYFETLEVLGSIGTGDTLTFKNLKVIDNRGRSTSRVHTKDSLPHSSGGVFVDNVDYVVFENSEISGNTLVAGYGAGLAAYNSNVVLKNTIIKNNSFLPDNVDSSQSTTIPASVIVKDSGFEEYKFDTSNFASIKGGAGVGVYGGSLEIIGGEIYGNNSNGLGGGVLAYAPLKINGAKIYDNEAVSGAGIVATMDAEINNAYIFGNAANSCGGGVWFASNLKVNNSNIYGNTAVSSGAGFYSNSEVASLIIDNTSIKENVSDGDGAGIDFRNKTGELKVTNSKFIGNRANGFGTAIFSETEPNISYTEFSGNYIEGNSLIHFGSVFATVLDNVTISGNYAKGDYATLFSFGNLTISLPRFDILNSRIYGNEADKNALIMIDKNIYFSINDSEVYGNSNKASDGKGGLINVVSGTLKLENGTLKNNFAKNGGSVYFSNGSSGLLINSTITGHSNTSSEEYCVNGAIYIENGAEVKFVGGEVTKNNIPASYGAIHNAGSLNFNGTNINNNLTGYGTIYNNTTGLLSFENIDFGYNTSKKGGAIFNKGTANLVSGEIYSNEALDETGVVNGNGGAIYNAESGLFTLTGGSIHFNKAKANGGAIFNKGHFVVNGGELFGNNVSAYGGAIYNDTAGKLIINDGEIYENGATSGSTRINGLAIANIGEMYMYGGEISNNYIEKTSSIFASSCGGAIYAGSNSYTLITGGYIDNNVAYNGGAIFAEAHSVVDINNITIDNTTINANTKAYGRAIYAQTATINLVNVEIKCGTAIGGNNDNVGSICSINSTITISGCVFMYNKDNKGVVSCKGGKLVVEDTLFENNKTEFENASSGILYLEGLQELSITYSDFVNNSTKGNGGAIAFVFEQEFNGIIENCLFENNSANGDGGAIYITAAETENTDSMLTIKNSTFVGNNAECSGGAIALVQGNGIEVVIEDCIFGGVKDKNGNNVIDANEYLGNVAGADGGAIAYLSSETALALTLKGNNEITYNKAEGVGGGIYYDYAYAANTASDYYGLKIESASMPIITNNTQGTNTVSNLYMLNIADRNILTTGLKQGSLVGITVVSANSDVIEASYIIAKGRDIKAPITSSDRTAFVYDNTKYLLKLDVTNNALVLIDNSTKFMAAVANDVVHAVDGHFKSVTAEDIQVVGVTDYTVTFASSEDGNYTAEGPKYTTKGTYTVWYKVVDNTGKNAPIIGSVTLKLTGKILLLENAPTAYINKGETLSQATFKGGLVLSDGSAVSGSWAFTNGTVAPTNTTQKYEVKFNPSNEYIYENEIKTYITINISYNRVFYVEDGFYVDKEGTKPTGITLLSEMVSCMKELGTINFVTTYVVGLNGVLSEDVYTDKKIYFSVTPLLGSSYMISIPSSGTPVKFTLGGGSGEIIIDGRAGYSVYNVQVPLFENNGILILKSNVTVQHFYNTEGGAAVVENNGELYLNGCTMYNNRSNNNSVECYGGVIYNTASVYVNGGDYRYNRAHGSDNLNGMGGFIYNDGGSVVINSGNFTRNIAYNGAFMYSNGGTITINGGEIYGNHAWNSGGAIYLTGNAQLDINGGNIMLNRAAKEGAGVFVDNSIIYLNGGVIKYNTVTSSVGFDSPEINTNINTENNSNWVAGVLSVVAIVAVLAVIAVVLKPKKQNFKAKKRK